MELEHLSADVLRHVAQHLAAQVQRSDLRVFVADLVFPGLALRCALPLWSRQGAVQVCATYRQLSSAHGCIAWSRWSIMNDSTRSADFCEEGP